MFEARDTRSPVAGEPRRPKRRKTKRSGRTPGHASARASDAAYCMNQPWLTTNDWPVSAAL
ncbi:hypothetical protein, partial [Burkholderia pseudomallei]|uniref:hypothetical protein n=1 Tax=Burkholderia pseudomallei TaxID=28450 RepID=UPI001C4DBABC